MVRITLDFLNRNSLLFFVLLFFAGCRDENGDKDIVTFKFEAANNPGLSKDYEMKVGEADITGAVPGADITQLVATFTINGVSALVDKQAQVSGVTVNNYTTPIVYWILAEDGSRKQYSAVITSRPISNAKEIHSFVVSSKDNPCITSDITAYIGDTHITCFIPTGCSEPVLSAVIEVSDGATVKINGAIVTELTAQVNHQEPLTYTIEAEDGSTKNYAVKFYWESGLPILNIKTRDYAPVVSKDDYLDASLAIDDSQYPYKGEIEIKGRGNSTWGLPKKPYRLKLKNKSEILGMPSDRDWNLIANYSDKTLLRNRVAFELGNRIGVAFTPRNQFVELVMNGEYVGNYLLTEQVEVEKSRVNINELAPTDVAADKITGGYLMEINARMDEMYCWKTKKGVRFCMKSPDETITTQQLAYIQAYLQETEDVMYGTSFADSDDGYAKYIDIESFVNWYIVNELLRNNDAIFYSSVYMFKDRGGKLNMGPIWDYDIAIGNVNFGGNDSPEGWHIRKAVWISRLFQDPAFAQKVDDRWDELIVDEIGTIFDFIDDEAAKLSVSQENNFRRWDILNKLVWPNPAVYGSYQGEVDHMKSWLQQRLTWIGGQ